MGILNPWIFNSRQGAAELRGQLNSNCCLATYLLVIVLLFI
jgi:hypothetical protein